MSDEPIKLTGQFNVPFHGVQLTCLNDMESAFEGFLQFQFKALYESNMEEDEMDDVVREFINRNDLAEITGQWNDYKDDVDDEIPGQNDEPDEPRDYPLSFTE